MACVDRKYLTANNGDLEKRGQIKAICGHIVKEKFESRWWVIPDYELYARLMELKRPCFYNIFGHSTRN